jgi:hypothetical protein
MQGNPGSPSGTYNYALPNGELMLEAYSRCGIRPTALTVDHTRDAYRSLNLALQSWANKGLNLFTLEQDVIQLEAGVATYVLSARIVSIADAYYNAILSTGQGPDMDFPLYDPSEPTVSNDPQVVITSSQDRWLQPKGRADYAMIPNKQQQGLPTMYWVDRLGPPYQLTITFWPVPLLAYPSAAVTYFGVRQIQDANLQNGETPDTPNRFLDALGAELAWRLARKYAPTLIGTPGSGGLLDDRNEAFLTAAGEDVDKGAPIMVAPNLSGYWR